MFDILQKSSWFLIDKQNLCVQQRSRDSEELLSKPELRQKVKKELELQFCEEEGTFIRHDLHFVHCISLPKSKFFEYSLKSFNYR